MGGREGEGAGLREDKGTSGGFGVEAKGKAADEIEPGISQAGAGAGAAAAGAEASAAAAGVEVAEARQTGLEEGGERVAGAGEGASEREAGAGEGVSVSTPVRAWSRGARERERVMRAGGSPGQAGDVSDNVPPTAAKGADNTPYSVTRAAPDGADNVPSTAAKGFDNTPYNIARAAPDGADNVPSTAAFGSPFKPAAGSPIRPPSSALSP
ncbi:hypothetical protein CLOM_g21243 [Closterium sp. NIES-68]|nr:hypothetical protein CLOM_g21243 [Closterium sp. NIES-68]